MQLPLPSQIMPVPQDVLAAAFVVLQTEAPVEQLVVPGLQVVPQDALGVQAAHVPLPSQNIFAPPQVVPPFALVWVHTGVPVEQLIVPGLQVLPHIPPWMQAMHEPPPSQT